MGKPNYKLIIFNDRLNLTDNFNVKIVKIIVFYDVNKLAGLKAIYKRESNGKTKIIGRK